ncbi:hypothetical protein HDU96_005504, partial [Phlyctochytrium bullatum]
DGEDEAKKTKKETSAGIEQATKALLGSIQTVFVLRDRTFMAGFLQEFKKFSGCKLGSDLLVGVLDSVKGEIDGWRKVSKYAWISLVQHPMIRRLFPNKGEETPLITIDPDGKYEIEPIPVQIQARDIKFDQLKNGNLIQLSKDDKIRCGTNEKVAVFTGTEFSLPLGSVSVRFSLGLSATVTVPKDAMIDRPKMKRTWGTVKLVVNQNEEIVLSVPFKLERVGTYRIPKKSKNKKYSKPLERRTRQVVLEEEEVFLDSEYPFIFY